MIVSDAGTTIIDEESGEVVHVHAYDECGQCFCGAWREDESALGVAAPRDADGDYACGCGGGSSHVADCEHFVDDGSTAGTYRVSYHRGDVDLEVKEFVVFNEEELEALAQPYGRSIGSDGCLVVWLHPEWGEHSMYHLSIEP